MYRSQSNHFGVTFDQHTTRKAPISSVCSAVHGHLRTIGSIRQIFKSNAGVCCITGTVSDHGQAGYTTPMSCSLVNQDLSRK